MPCPSIYRLALIAMSCTTWVVSATPSLARPHHHAPVVQQQDVPTSHAAIPQNANIENLNNLSLTRARAGQNTTAPLAPPLAQ